MDHLRSVLLDAQKLGLIPAGSSEVTERLRDVDAKDIRKLAKLVHGWQTKCVETQSKPFVEKSDWKAAGGAGDMLKAARERGLIRTEDEFYREQKKYRKQTMLQNAMSTSAEDFDISRYKVVVAELQEKLKWVEMYIKSWKDRLIEDHEQQVSSLDEVLQRCRRVQLIADDDNEAQTEVADLLEQA
jgi:hypothetical protein